MTTDGSFPCDAECALNRLSTETVERRCAEEAVRRWRDAEIAPDTPLSYSSTASACAADCIRRCFMDDARQLTNVNVSGAYY
jgi:hypothetical protein